MSRLRNITPVLQKARSLQTVKLSGLRPIPAEASRVSSDQRRKFSSGSGFTGQHRSNWRAFAVAAALGASAVAAFSIIQNEEALAYPNKNLEGHNFPGTVPIDIELYSEGSRVHHAGVIAHIDADYEESERCHRRAIELRSRIAGPDAAYDLAQSLGALSGTLLRAGKHELAHGATEGAVEQFKTIIDLCHMDMNTLTDKMEEARKNATGPLVDAAPVVPAWIGNAGYHDSKTITKPTEGNANPHHHHHHHHGGAPAGHGHGSGSSPHGHGHGSGASPHGHGASPHGGSPHGAMPHFRGRHKPGNQLSTLGPLVEGCDHFNRGVELNNSGKFEEAAAEFGKAVEIRKSELEDDDWYEVAQALAAQGDALLRAKKYEDAYHAMSEAKSVYKSVVEAMYANTSGFLVYLADIHAKAHKFQQAYKDITEALDLVKITPGQPMLAYTHMKVGQIAEAMGNLDDALVNMEAAWTNMVPRMRHSAKAGDLLNQIGCLLIESANSQEVPEEAKKAFARARGYLQQSVEVYRKVLPESDPEMSVIFSNLGEAAFGEGSLEDALKFHAESKDIRVKSLGERHPFVGLSILSMGKSELARGNYAQAKSLFLECANVLGLSVDMDVLRSQPAPETLGHGGFTVIDQLVMGLLEADFKLNKPSSTSQQ